jgi:hypothetical protein
MTARGLRPLAVIHIRQRRRRHELAFPTEVSLPIGQRAAQEWGGAALTGAQEYEPRSDASRLKNFKACC